MALIAIQRVVFAIEIRLKDGGITGVQIIAHGHAHATLLRALAIHRRSRFHADVGELLAAFIAIQIARGGIVGNIYVLLPAAIEI